MKRITVILAVVVLGCALVHASASDDQTATDIETEQTAPEEQVAADTEAEPAALEEEIAADTEAEPEERSLSSDDTGAVDALVETVVRSDCPQIYKSGNKIRYGGRIAFSHFNNKKVNPSGDWKESRAKGMIVSPGLATSIPFTGAVSLNHELVLDIRSIDLEVDVYSLSPATLTTSREKLKAEGLKEYVVCLPITLRFDVDLLDFYVENGVRFDYLYTSSYRNTGMLDRKTSRPQIDMGAILGAGYRFSLFSSDCYLGYRIEGNITQFDTRNFFRFRRHTFGLTVMGR